ncbi:hypothetical protein [Aeromonas salmonicida]|uniref:hypothetical protein n=1 Tax=Aeromonas salmonicida TaxID=645 RepID=UPI003F7BA65A
MKTKRQHIYAGAFVSPDMKWSNAFLIVTDRDNPVGRMKAELEAHTEQVWNYQPAFNFELDKHSVKQMTAMNRMIALIETRNSIEEDEFEFIRFE